MRRKKMIAGVAAAVVAVQAMHETAQAAVVTFNAPQVISGVSDVSTAGTVLYAYNMGTTTSQTVNGVTFTGWAPATLTTSAGTAVTPPDSTGNASLFSATQTHSGGFATAGNGGTAGAIGAIASSSPSYYNLLNSELFSTDGGPACTITLTLQNLTPTVQYQFEMWVDDSRGGSNQTNGNQAIPTRFDAVSTAGGSTVDLQFSNATVGSSAGQGAANGVGEYVIGTFTADSSSQVISIDGGDNTSQNPDAGLSPQLAGFDVEIVPEPASAALIVLGITAIACRRRRA
jgi:hypothetical protein